MLGRLARYLRLMGYDVSYPQASSDARLIATARTEGRVLLTRDRGISLRDGPRAGNPIVIEIASDEIMSQLAQLVGTGWVTRFLEPRCSLCNARLEPMGGWEARHLLPPFTLATQCLFLYCSSCNTVLWEGSHWKHFRESTMPAFDLARKA
ncbi:MAG: hypothetical protein JW854_03920 [Actinobacteria bacterium]|nr:hypothetical protein [Actinomycetota bacterium]